MSPRGRRARRYERPVRIQPHLFVADEAIPADWKGRQTCSVCRAAGEPGDQRHPTSTPAPPTQPAHVRHAQAARDAAILGESGDDDAA